MFCSRNHTNYAIPAEKVRLFKDPKPTDVRFLLQRHGARNSSKDGQPRRPPLLILTILKVLDLAMILGGAKRDSTRGREGQTSQTIDSEDRGRQGCYSLASGLNILWTPGSNEPSTSAYTSTSCLPAPELLNDALSNYLLSMQPQIQHRAAYATSSGSPVEPTLALHCPIEGGDYIIDETVRELARRTDSDVITLDAAQLAAGEWGAFGKGERFSEISV